MISSMPKWVGDLFSNTLRPNMKVLSVTQLSPQIRRVRFQGDISKMNFEIGYANVLRVSDTEYRNYTAAYYNKEDGILDILFHLHGRGPGSQYANRLRPADEVFISPPRGRNFYNPKMKQQFIFGDETSLGLACSFLSVLEQDTHGYQFYLELEEGNKDVPGLLGLKNYTIVSPKGFQNERWLKDNLPILQESDLDSANFILTGNVKSVQTLRQVLRNRTRGKVFVQGYWLEGKKGL